MLSLKVLQEASLLNLQKYLERKGFLFRLVKFSALDYSIMMRVFTNGCFDILHKGHVELLAYCKSLGHVTVGLNSDESVKRLKGLSRPINTENDRKRILEALRYVDEVVVFHEDTPYDLISKLKPDVIVKGGDYRAQDVIGSDICDVRVFDMVRGYSTTSFINRIISK